MGFSEVLSGVLELITKHDLTQDEIKELAEILLDKCDIKLETSSRRTRRESLPDSLPSATGSPPKVPTVRYMSVRVPATSAPSSGVIPGSAEGGITEALRAATMSDVAAVEIDQGSAKTGKTRKYHKASSASIQEVLVQPKRGDPLQAWPIAIAESEEGEAEEAPEDKEEETPVPKSAISLLQANRELVEYKQVDDGAIVKHVASRSMIRLWWNEKPKKILLIKKPGVPEVTARALEIIDWLNKTHGIKVLVEPAVVSEEGFVGLPYLRTWKSQEDFKKKSEDVDFVIGLGGDGTLLWINTLFQGAVPPVLSFAMGSLGFLTAHKVEDYVGHLSRLVGGGFYLSLRSRLVCKIYKSAKASSREVSEIPTDTFGRMSEDSPPKKPRGECVATFHALNEVTIDRGNSPYLSNLNCFLDDNFLTVARADGLIVSTATGSTAYNLAAGGSLLHPDVPAMLFTPVCPHSLSFRPLVFPDGARILIEVEQNARGTAWVSCDGKHRTELCFGDFVEVFVSKYPLPSVCLKSETEDWFRAVRQGLQWNARG